MVTRSQNGTQVLVVFHQRTRQTEPDGARLTGDTTALNENSDIHFAVQFRIFQRPHQDLHVAVTGEVLGYVLVIDCEYRAFLSFAASLPRTGSAR